MNDDRALDDAEYLIELALASGRIIYAGSYWISDIGRWPTPMATDDVWRTQKIPFLQRALGAWPVHRVESNLRRDPGGVKCLSPRFEVAARFVSWPPDDPNTIEYLIIVWYQERPHPMMDPGVVPVLLHLDWDRLAEPVDY